jgi:hypothetical protein
MKPTAVEFAVEQLEQLIPFGHQLAVRIILEQALEMEKQQLKEMYLKGIENYDPTFKSQMYVDATPNDIDRGPR